MMNKRLLMLEKMVDSGQADSFARYALALEYKKDGQLESAIKAFAALRATDPNYLPQYLMAGQMLIDAGKKEEARDWLQGDSSGVAAYRMLASAMRNGFMDTPSACRQCGGGHTLIVDL
jgi:predicted Zn-dependent protease